jgi:excisionase family DNA binding protein
MREYIGTGVLGVKELARYMAVSEITVYRLLEKGRIPGKKVGAQWRFLKSEIDDWLKDRN